MNKEQFTIEHIRAAMEELMNNPPPKTNLGAIYELAKKQTQVLEEAVRKNATPPIKGKLTVGKLRWRGLRLNQSSDLTTGTNEMWVTQRGVLVSPKIKITYAMKLTNNKNQ